MVQLVAVGACYLDTILTVPHYPAEDTKLRATSLTRRRGGNCPNTLEVLSQLLAHSSEASARETRLDLCAVLPTRSAPATREVLASLPGVEPSMCMFREGAREAPCSFVVQSQGSNSRTIVNFNGLAEMSVAEFKACVERGLGRERMWVHFEGRNTGVALECMRYLRKRIEGVEISVEVEKPGREGLEEMAAEADVVFYSRAWVQDKGFGSVEEFLESLSRRRDSRARLSVCTWGEVGCGALSWNKGGEASIQTSVPQELTRAVVDTNGAGDTFTAGLLYTELRGADRWSMEQRLAFANDVAGRKIIQDGFEALGEAMKSSRMGWML